MSSDDALQQYLDAHPDLKAKLEELAKHMIPRSPLDPPLPPVTVNDIAGFDEITVRADEPGPWRREHLNQWVGPVTHYTLTAAGVWICNRCHDHVWDPARHEASAHSAPNRYTGIAAGASFPAPPPPNTNVVFRYVSDADGMVVYVKYDGEHWVNSETPNGPWERDDRIREWNGTFFAYPEGSAFANPARERGFGFAAGGVWGGTTAHSPIGEFVVDERPGPGWVHHTMEPCAVEPVITDVVDETHVMRDAAPAPGESAASAAYRFMMANEVPTFRDGEAATDAIIAMSKRRIAAEDAARERLARDWLTAKVREEIASRMEGHRGVSQRPDLAAHAYTAAAVAAVEVFLEFLRERPTIVEDPDGHLEIREVTPPAADSAES